MAQDRSPEAVAERLRLSLEMFDDAVEMLRLKLQRSHPRATEAEIAEMIERWIAHRPGAEEGDYVDTAPDPTSES